MDKKYELTNETVVVEGCGTSLYRIRALKDFGDVKAGDLGGYIEKESNLSQHGNCWICDEAKVYGDAEVTDNAEVHDYARISGNAVVCDDARVYESARIYQTAKIKGVSQVGGRAIVHGNTVLLNTIVGGHAQVIGGEYIDQHLTWFC